MNDVFANTPILFL